jgi:hypothetical protein
MHGNPSAQTKSLMFGICSQSKITLIDSHAMIDTTNEKTAEDLHCTHQKHSKYQVCWRTWCKLWCSICCQISMLTSRHQSRNSVFCHFKSAINKKCARDIMIIVSKVEVEPSHPKVSSQKVVLCLRKKL